MQFGEIIRLWNFINVLLILQYISNYMNVLKQALPPLVKIMILAYLEDVNLVFIFILQ